MTLSRDYRPTEIDQLWGNRAMIASFKSVYFEREHDYPHAVMLCGPKGCGKTTIARIIANILESYGSDLVEIDGGTVNAEMVRQVKQQIRYKPMVSKSRVWIIDEAHMIGQGGGSEKNIPQNNMLKTLEEPPAHAFFILCTTDPARLLGTIHSRCHIFEVSYLSRGDMLGLLKETLEKENMEIDEEVLKEISDASEGCPRDALKIMDQIIDMDPKEMIDAVQRFGLDEKNIVDLGKALFGKQSWDRVRKIVAGIDLSNPESARRAIIGWMAKEIMKGDNPDAALIYDCFREPLYATGKPGFVFACYQAVISLL